MQQNCSCADACESSTFTQDDSLSSFSKLSIENLLDHDTKTIGKKYKAVKELRERVEEERIADFLSKLLKISHGLTKFIRYTSYVASSGTASIRTLSEKAIKAFYVSVINKDIDYLFGDIDNYTESYEAMYRPSRRLIEKQLADVSDEVTYYIKMLHTSKETPYNAETFKNNVYGVASELLKQITKAEIIVETLDYENAYSNKLFSGGEHWAFKPTRLFESKKLDDDCKDIRNSFNKSMETMKKEVKELTDYLSANLDNITDDIIVNNHSTDTYTIGTVDVVDMMVTLHTESLPLREKIKEYRSCLNYYYSFIQSVQNFRAQNIHSEDEEYLSDIQFDAEVKQSELISTKGVLNQLEIEIAQYTKKKQEIGEQINSTLVTAMEKKLESVRSSVTTEVFDKITDKISSIRTTMSKNYIQALKHINTLQEYFTKTKEEEGRPGISEKAKQLWILRHVRK